MLSGQLNETKTQDNITTSRTSKDKSAGTKANCSLNLKVQPTPQALVPSLRNNMSSRNKGNNFNLAAMLIDPSIIHTNTSFFGVQAEGEISVTSTKKSNY